MFEQAGATLPLVTMFGPPGSATMKGDKHLMSTTSEAIERASLHMMKHNHSLYAQPMRTGAAPGVADWREGVVMAYQAAREQEINTMCRTMAERLRVLIGQTI